MIGGGGATGEWGLPEEKGSVQLTAPRPNLLFPSLIGGFGIDALRGSGLDF